MTDLKAGFFKLLKFLGDNEDQAELFEGDPQSFTHLVTIAKSVDDERLVYGVVYEPDVADAHGDFADAGEIRDMCHGFGVHYALAKSDNGVEHFADLPREAVAVVESYIAPVDFTLGVQPVTKGSWVMGAKVFDDALWKGVKDGTFTGWSFEGEGYREAV